MELKTYTCKPGDHNFLPNKIPALFNLNGSFGMPRRLAWCFEVNETLWYDWSYTDPTDGVVKKDGDWGDFWKVVGASKGILSPMNAEAVMLAMHPWGTVEDKKFKFTVYRNFDGGKWDNAELEARSFILSLAEMVGKQWIFELSKGSDKSKLRAYLYENGKAPIISQTDIPCTWGSGKEIFLWFGGENNSPGPYGGVASQNMVIKCRSMHM